MQAYQPLVQLFSEHLKLWSNNLDSYKPAELYNPANYILSLGGKRLRPLLALVTCDLYGANPKNALHSALAVELFHNFSLIHDDILDEAPLRRNSPTVHKKWGGKIAILSGDALMVKSFQALQHYPPSEFAMLSTLFLQTAINVCEGQQEDMNFETRSIVPVEEYLHMITRKTAVLLGCSMQMGAINAGATEAEQKYIYEFGKQLGIAFQLLDDLLDAFTTDAAKFGKQIGGDILSNKKTFLLAKAQELANPNQKVEIEQILALNAESGAEKVTRMLNLFESLHIRELCQKEADKHTDAAIKALGATQTDAAKKEVLIAFAHKLLNRDI